MTRNIFSTLILWVVCCLLVFFCFIIAASAQEPSGVRPAHIGLCYPLSTNGLEAPSLSNRFSLHALYGVSQKEYAFCLSGITSVIKSDAGGLVLSGVSNHIGHNAQGAQVAGILNQVRGAAAGMQMAGVANISGTASGLQLAGVINIAGHAAHIQVAGFASKAQSATAQVSGFCNIAKRTGALQLAGFANIARDASTQVSGFLNIARKVKGVQVGIVNIAEQSDYPVGLVNIVKNGEKQLGLSADETGSLLVSLRSGGRTLYGILGAGYNFKDASARYVLEGGIGAHLPIKPYFRINMEIATAVLSDLQYDAYMKTTTRLLAALRIGRHIELFAGPSFNYLGYERGQTDIRSQYLWKERSRSHVNGLYFGATGGIQLNL